VNMFNTCVGANLREYKQENWTVKVRYETGN
jgi:hypothetical protein